MDTLRAFQRAALSILLATLVIACEDSPSLPPPPPAPPQLGLELYNTSNGLVNDEVFDILVDAQNRTWFSTDDGVLMIEGSDTVAFGVFDGLPNRQCRGLAELGGKVFVGTWGGGVAYYDGSPSWTALPVAGDARIGLTNGRVFSMAVDDTSLWICTVGGVSQYVDDDTRPMDDRWMDHSFDLGETPVRMGLTYDDPQRGPEAWFATEREGLAVLRIPGIRDVSGSADGAEQRTFAVGDRGTILELDGDSWVRHTSRTQSTLRSVMMLRRNLGYAVGDDGTVLRFNGLGWYHQTTPTSVQLNNVWAVNPDTIFAVGNDGAVMEYNRWVGQRWRLLNAKTSEDINGVWALTWRDVFAVGTNGTILIREAGWRPLDSGTNETLNAVWGTNPHDVFAVGDGGTIVHYDTSETWMPMASGVSQSLRGVWGSSSDNVFAVGEGGVILRYDGAAWSTMSGGTSPDLVLSGVWGRGSGRVYVVGELESYTNGSDQFHNFDGISWSPMKGGTKRLLSAFWLQRANSGLPDDQVSDLVHDPQRDLVWLTLSKDGVASVDGGMQQWTHLTRLDGLDSDLATSVGVRSNGDVWIGTQTGVTRLEPSGRLMNFAQGSGLPDPRIRRVYVDRNDRVWLAFIGAGAGRVKNADIHKD